MQALLQRAGQSILNLLGEDALFRGDTQTKINVEWSVEFTGYDDTAKYKGDLTVTYDIATISKLLSPKLGDSFVFTDKTGVLLDGAPTYRLEKRVEDNGVNPRFVILKLETP